MVTGWFDDKIEVDRLATTGDRTDYEVKFAVGGDHRSFRLGITNSITVTWSNSVEGFDLNEAAEQLANALLARGADQMPHDRYLFSTTSPSTLEGTLQTIDRGVGGVNRWAWPENS